MNIEVDANAANTKLLELLRGVQAGNHSTITLRGEAIASLVPPQDNKCTDAVAAAEAMLSFMMAQISVGIVDIKALISEGRA